MLSEPFQGILCHLLDRSRFFEQMCRTRNDHQLLWAAKKPVGLLIHFNHGVIFATDKQQGWCGHVRQMAFGEVRTPAARDDGTSKEVCAAAWSAEAAPVLAPK